MNLKEFQDNFSRLLVLLALLFLTACGNNSSSKQRIQGESSLLLNGSANLEDLIFLSLEHATSLYKAEEDLHDLGSDLVVYNGKEGNWQICLQGDFEFVSVELINSNSEKLLTVNSASNCATAEIHDQKLSLKVLNISPDYLHHFVFIETVFDSQLSEWISLIKVSKATTSRSLQTLSKSINLGARSAEVRLSNDTSSNLVVQLAYVSGSAAWVEGEQPQVGNVFSQYQSVTYGSYTNDPYGSTPAFVTFTGVGTPIRVSWDLNTAGEFSYSIESNSLIKSQTREQSTQDLNHRMWLGTFF